MPKFFNIWFFFSLLISIFVIIPILTVFSSFFEETSNYYELLKNTFLIEYIFNSSVLLICVLASFFNPFLSPKSPQHVTTIPAKHPQTPPQISPKIPPRTPPKHPPITD